MLLSRIRKYIDSDELTVEQRAVCHQAGNFVVCACPGSGKTRTTGTLLALRLAQWDRRRAGIAALSFTNVAKDEIGAQLRRLGFDANPGWPHFLGTIDSFVNQEIFLPYGHTAMTCSRRPEVVHPSSPSYRWVAEELHHSLNDCRQKGCTPLCFTFLANGALEWCGAGNQPKCGRQSCEKLKHVMVRAGYASPTDAMFWAYKILESVPLRRAIASRYPMIIVDEAQDTSETQFGILHLLASAGSNVALIGDPNQAIFGFSGAQPDLFTEFSSQVPTLCLTANFRSSQLICDTATLFVSGQVSHNAAGPDRAFPAPPFLWVYTKGTEATVLKKFESTAANLGLELSKCAVLARKHTTLRRIGGGKAREWPSSVRSVSRVLARAAVLREQGSLAEGHKLVMSAMLKLCIGKSSFGLHDENLGGIGIRQWRRGTWKVLVRLPNSGLPISQWGPAVRGVIEPFLFESKWPLDMKLSTTLCKCNGKDANVAVREFCNVPSAQGIRHLVVHQAKGQTFEGVLLIAAHRTKNTPADIAQWLDKVEGDETRVAYVAVTRPRRLLVLAVPDDTTNESLKVLSQKFKTEQT
jgi:hypothetical protein